MECPACYDPVLLHHFLPFARPPLAFVTGMGIDVYLYCGDCPVLMGLSERMGATVSRCWQTQRRLMRLQLLGRTLGPLCGLAFAVKDNIDVLG